jgi:2-keto-4-pentenoate hydratase/2-oxohepta-3-ene-1,7-dioic acid hydratase in catechol pathway
MPFVTIKSSDERIAVRNVLCVGRNYAEHAKELNSEVPTEPVFFLKPASAVMPGGGMVVAPSNSGQMHYETEIVLLMGDGGQDIPIDQAQSKIKAYGIGLDMTLRDVQNRLKDKKLPWFLSKGFDTSAPVSEFVLAAQVKVPEALELTGKVNGVVRQSSNAGKMLFNYSKLINFISHYLAIQEGDLIFTGTPEGVGPVAQGDVIEAELVGYAKLTAKVAIQ